MSTVTIDEARLGKIFRETGADALFLGQDYLRRYITGFYATDGYLVYDGKICTFVADLRYYEAASAALEGSFIRVAEGSFTRALELVAGCKTLGVPFSDITRAECLYLEERGFQLVNCTPALRASMLIKTPHELACVARACEMAEDGLLAVLPRIREGVTERELAAMLEYEMRMQGADGTSFETIVAFGSGTSVPHHETGDTRLKYGDPVLIDFGCKTQGYCSDCTRTFLFGDNGKNEEFRKMYAVVLEAHERVKERLVSGMTAKQADAIARDLFREKGLDGYFTHSLGHGVGLQIHEQPYIAPRVNDVLQDGMVFSDEPGLYFAGRYGIRIEDSVCLENGRVRSFMHKTQHELLVL